MKNLNEQINHAIDNISINANEIDQLAQARQQALDGSKHSLFSSFSSPIMVYASLFLVVGFISFTTLNMSSDFTETTPRFDESFSLLSSQEPVEMYEDLEFYMWLETELTSSKRNQAG